MIIDSHAHYDDEAFNDDREAVLKGLYDGNVEAVINSGAGMKSSRSSEALSEKFPFIYATVGVHPDNAGELNEKTLHELEEMALKQKVVGIGEIGLDYHWDVWERNVQKEAFLKQWELADRLDLPVVIHSRDAAEDTMTIIRKKHSEAKQSGRELKAELHCYSYSPEQALEYASMGMYFGVGGVVTFKNARKLVETVETVPVERIMLETDCPYLAPEPYRGKRNDSTYIKYVAEKIGQIKGLSPEEVIDITTANVKRFYRL